MRGNDGDWEGGGEKEAEWKEGLRLKRRGSQSDRGREEVDQGCPEFPGKGWRFGIRRGRNGGERVKWKGERRKNEIHSLGGEELYDDQAGRRMEDAERSSTLCHLKEERLK